MIIDSSNVGMASSRTYSSAAVYQTETMNAKSEQAVLLDLSDESKTLMEQMKDIKNQQELCSRFKMMFYVTALIFYIRTKITYALME